jgi:putative protease
MGLMAQHSAHKKRDSSENIPELLAPAGNLATAITAYESGADAVYCGLSRFNAREMGENFSFEEMSKLAGYAHKNGKAFYVTFNTLLKEGELEEAVCDLRRIASLEPHGVIVQDLGVVRMLRELFPEVPIHASTQMGIHNSAGIQTAARMGIERVILERQVTLEELRQLMQRSPIDVEVFVHGALCCSLSGRCLFSSWIGGWSGNRGKCKQPCRRRYYTQENGRKRAGFFFSTQDLYSLDLLKTLTDLGVVSLKIEGRLKKSDYVKSVVGAYRMVLDDIAAGRRPDIKAAKAVLAESYGRRWSHGFGTEEDMRTVILPDNLGVSGMRVGRVAGRTASGIQVEIKKRLRVGDRIRVQPDSGGEGPSFTIRELRQGGEQQKSVSRGEAEIPTDREMPEEGFIYRIGTSRKNPGPDPGELPVYRPPRRIELDIELGYNGLTVEAAERNGGEKLTWRTDIGAEAARSKAIDGETVSEMFTASRSSALAAGRITVRMGEDLFVPLSRLKQARREFWRWLENHLPAMGEMDEGTEDPALLLDRLRAPSEEEEQGSRHKGKESAPEGAAAETVCALDPGMPVPDGCTAAAEELTPNPTPGREVELPHFSPEGELAHLDSTLRKALESRQGNSTADRFRITDLGHFHMLEKREGIRIVTGYPLPATNSLAVRELQDLGAERVQAWIELDRQAMEELLRSVLMPMEVYAYGRPFILVTRAELPAEGSIVDGRGKEFEIYRSRSRGLTYLYPPERFRIEPPADVAVFKDYRNDSPKLRGESSFNFEVEFV